MRTVNLKIQGGNSSIASSVFIDNKKVKFKKNQYAAYDAIYSTEKDEIEISISKHLELASRLWWLYALLSYLVSIFGIFNPPYSKESSMINCKLKVKLTDNNNILLKVNNSINNPKAVEVVTNNEFTEIHNQIYVDKKIKTRRTIIKLFTILSWIAMVIIVINILAKRF